MSNQKMMRFAIDSYSFGLIVVNGKRYTSDIIILKSGIIDDWWRKIGHELSLDDIKAIIADNPELVIVGTGASGMMRVLPEVEKKFKELKIELIVEQTTSAWKTYNELSKKGRRAAASLHLTC